MAEDKGLIVAGSIIGALAWGVPGAIVGGLVGSALQQAANMLCVDCKIAMQLRNGISGDYYQCPHCGKIKPKH